MAYCEICNEGICECDKVIIDCVGVDDRRHRCEPHKDTAKCGMKVKRKKNIDKINLAGCWECTY
ncbi:MAG: hypothetical protein DRH97_00080 [Chloroflexi bacterium]|nr:MAG: hypothetical protein DRH97_00080 [Chloroflexota bacterium]